MMPNLANIFRNLLCQESETHLINAQGHHQVNCLPKFAICMYQVAFIWY